MLTAFLLGAFHGVNPAMGWLFAVALGLQERDRKAVLRAFLPMAAGHFAAAALSLSLFFPLRYVLGGGGLRAAAAALLVGFGLFHLARARHPKWGGMQIGAGGLMFWSFLAASAHGAGFMLAPFLPEVFVPHDGAHTKHVPAAADVAGHWALALTAHTAGFFTAMALVAVVVYEKLGVSLLRRAWINMDAVWAGCLIITGALIPFL